MGRRLTILPMRSSKHTYVQESRIRLIFLHPFQLGAHKQFLSRKIKGKGNSAWILLIFALRKPASTKLFILFYGGRGHRSYSEVLERRGARFFGFDRLLSKEPPLRAGGWPRLSDAGGGGGCSMPWLSGQPVSLAYGVTHSHHSIPDIRDTFLPRVPPTAWYPFLSTCFLPVQ